MPFEISNLLIVINTYYTSHRHFEGMDVEILNSSLLREAAVCDLGKSGLARNESRNLQFFFIIQQSAIARSIGHNECQKCQRGCPDGLKSRIQTPTLPSQSYIISQE